MSNLEWLEGMLKEAKENLYNVKELQKEYPDSFSLELSVDGWRYHIHDLEKKIKAEKEQKKVE